MNLYLRLVLTILRSLLEQPLSTRLPCRQRFRVLPNDIDMFGHMNNGRFLQVMDVARMRWLIRTGTIRTMRRQGWTVALGGNITHYRRPLKLFARYDVTTRLLCWDARWFFLQHVFFDLSGEQLAVGLSRAAFRHRGRWLLPDDVMQEVEAGLSSPPIPSYIAEWLSADRNFCGRKHLDRQAAAAPFGKLLSVNSATQNAD